MLRKLIPLVTLLALALTALPASGQDYQSVQARYFITQDDCGSGADNARMSTTVGAFKGGCAFIAAPANEVFGLTGNEYLTNSFPQQDRETFLLDGAGEVTGQVATFGFFGRGTSAGLVTIDVTVTATPVGSFSPVTLVDETYELNPMLLQDRAFEFSADIDDALDKVLVGSLNTDIVVRGFNAYSTIDTGGGSLVDIDHLVPVS